jgi:hypothetical protein
MGSARTTWHQVDLTRAMKACSKADRPVTRTVIAPDGTITLFHGEEAMAKVPENPFDKWKAARGH